MTLARGEQLGEPAGRAARRGPRGRVLHAREGALVGSRDVAEVAVEYFH